MSRGPELSDRYCLNHVLLSVVLLSSCAPHDATLRQADRQSAQAEQAAAARVLEDSQRELSIEQLAGFKTMRGPRRDGKLWGHDVIGVYEGQRFVAEYICSDLCPEYTVTVHHFVDLRDRAACVAFGGRYVGVTVPMGIGSGARTFCLPQMRPLYQLPTQRPGPPVSWLG